MKRITLFTLSLLSVLLVASCSSNDDDEKASLKVTPKTLEFVKEGEAKTFKVTVNAGNSFTATKETTADWATITDAGDIVTVTTVANTTAETRTVRIVVKTTSGGLQDYVSISQAGTVDVFEVTPPTIEFSDLGGENKITVTSTVADWTVEGSAAWLTLVPNLALGEVKVTAQANTGTADRTVVIKIKRGTVEKPVTITQKAKKPEMTEDLVLPYLTFDVAKEEVLKYETDRGHTYVLVPASGQNSEYYKVTTQSTLMPEVRLYFMPKYKQSIVLNSIPEGETAKIEKFLVDYAALLVENGFTKRLNDVYIKPAASQGYEIRAQLYIDGVVFKLAEIRPAQPTFSEFPYGLMTWGVGETEIRDYEAANLKGIFDAENSNPAENGRMQFNPAPDDDQYLVRGYFFIKANYIDYIASLRRFTDTSKFVYFPTATTYSFTDEYLILIESEGFEYAGTTTEGDVVYTKPATAPGKRIAMYHSIYKTAVDIEIGYQDVPTKISPMKLTSFIKESNSFRAGKVLEMNTNVQKASRTIADILK